MGKIFHLKLTFDEKNEDTFKNDNNNKNAKI